MGFVSPNPLVGCVIVKDGKIIAEGYHHKYGEKHAEVDALDKVAGRAKGATLYVNLEPCCIKGKTPPCTDRIVKEGISKVFIGNLDPNPKISGKGIITLKQNGVQVRSGILKDECRMLNQFFFKWITTGIPYITLKIARTSNDFIAYTNGSCPHISSDESRKEVHKLRSFYDSVLIGKNTALKDNPKLTVRKVKGRQPIRIILDSKGELMGNQNLNLLNDKYTDKTMLIRSKGKRVNLKKLLKNLGKQGISSVLVEGGPRVWSSFIKNKLADQLIVYTGPQSFKNGIKYSSDFDIEKIAFVHKEEYKKGPDKVMRKILRIY